MRDRRLSSGPRAGPPPRSRSFFAAVLPAAALHGALLLSGASCELSRVGLGPDDVPIESGAGRATPQSTPDAARAEPYDASPFDVSGIEASPPAEAAPSDDADQDDGANDASGRGCDFSGTWAIRVSVDVTWVPQGLTGVILAPGSGRITEWVRSTWAVRGSDVSETMVVCGIALPDFQSTAAAGSETYGIRLPDALFDNGYLAPVAVQGTLVTSGGRVSYSSAPIAVLIGLTLSSPLTDPWPTTVTTAVDTDQDGKPGVTAEASTAAGYSMVAVDLLKTRADRLYLAIRHVVQVTAAADACDHFTGSVVVPQIPPGASGKYAIDSHVLGCRLAASGSDCSTLQSGFVDATQPVFSPSGPSDYRATRIAPTSVCADVRQALP